MGQQRPIFSFFHGSISVYRAFDILKGFWDGRMANRSFAIWALAAVVWLTPGISSADLVGYKAKPSSTNLTISSIAEKIPAAPTIISYLMQWNVILSNRPETERKKPILGEKHEPILWAMNAAAQAYSLQGQYEQAESTYLKIIEMSGILFGEMNTKTLAYKASLGVFYAEHAKYDKTEPLLTEVLQDRRTLLGKKNLATISSMNDLAVLYAAQGRYEQAQ